MPIVCQSPNCDHEFHDDVMFDGLDALDAGETPFFTHVREADDLPGVKTSYLCSAECMMEYLIDQAVPGSTLSADEVNLGGDLL